MLLEVIEDGGFHGSVIILSELMCHVDTSLGKDTTAVMKDILWNEGCKSHSLLVGAQDAGNFWFSTWTTSTVQYYSWSSTVKPMFFHYLVI